MPKPESFLVIERSLAQRLRETWTPIGGRISAAILVAFAADDYTALNNAINRIKLARAMEGNTKYAKTMSWGAIAFGASRVQPIAKIKALDTPGTKATAVQAVAQISLMLEEASKSLRRGIREAINKERDRQVEESDAVTVRKADIVEAFASTLGKTMIEGKGLIDLTASLHTARLASFGHTVEAKLENRKTYVVNAMLDVRTCPICSWWNGKVFQVEVEHQRLLQVFATTTIEDLKRAAPWPKQNKDFMETVTAMTSTEFQNMGFGIPAHPWCRCYPDVDETGEQLVNEVTIPSAVTPRAPTVVGAPPEAGTGIDPGGAAVAIFDDDLIDI
jgi:hypothetical protein